jgi:5'-nucleotidase (lipoprotein e(P4) family)
MRPLVSAAALLLAGCTSTVTNYTPPPAPVATPAPVTLESDAPDSMRWLFGSGEAAGASIQAFRQLADFAIAKSRQRSVPQSVTMGLPGSADGVGQPSCRDGNRMKPLAVVLDVDETLLLNLGAEYQKALRGGAFDPELWAAWERDGSPGAAPVPGAVTALRALRAAGITPVFNTNRAADSAAQTEAAINAAGLGLAVHRQTLFLRGDDNTGSRKDTRRAAIAQRWCVIAMAGDNLGDFADVFNDAKLGVQERRQLAGRGQFATLWGNGWFVLPNPVYGPSIRGAIGDVFPPDTRWQPGTQVRAAPDIMSEGD